MAVRAGPNASGALGNTSQGAAGAGSPDAGNQYLLTIAQQLSALVTALQAAFPAATASTTSATAGGASALPALPVGYLVVTLPGGGVGKIPYYAT